MKGNATNRQKVYLCTTRECIVRGAKCLGLHFRLSVAEMLQQEQLRHILSCCSPFTSRGVKEGSRGGKGKYVHSSPANPSKRKFLQSYIIVLVYKIDLITFSACNLIFSQLEYQWLIFENSNKSIGIFHAWISHFRRRRHTKKLESSFPFNCIFPATLFYPRRFERLK